VQPDDAVDLRRTTLACTLQRVIKRKARAMQPSSYSDIIRRLRELGLFGDDRAAADALRATLEALGGVLRREEREALCRALPPELTTFVHEATVVEHGSAREVFLGVALHAGVRLGRAVEYAEAVCRVLGETMTPTARARILHALPEIGELLQPPEEVLRQDGQLLDADGPRAEQDSERFALHSETKHSTACGLAAEREARILSPVRHRGPTRRNG
jgi:uncharacterized protein (DUF2267 family)